MKRQSSVWFPLTPTCHTTSYGNIILDLCLFYVCFLGNKTGHKSGTTSTVFCIFLPFGWWILSCRWWGACDILHGHWNVYSVDIRGQSIKKPNFFLNLLLYLQLNQSFLLQSTPLHSWYTAPNIFSSSGTRPVTCFAGWRKGPLSNFLLSPLPSEIGEPFSEDFNFGNKKKSAGAKSRQ